MITSLRECLLAVRKNGNQINDVDMTDEDLLLAFAVNPLIMSVTLERSIVPESQPLKTVKKKDQVSCN